jgi:hypothetical protein
VEVTSGGLLTMRAAGEATITVENSAVKKQMVVRLATFVETPTPAPTAPQAHTATPATPSPTVRRCVGDCDGSGDVTINEIITMVNIALGDAPTTSCNPGDMDRDGQITVDEILTAVNNALTGCSAA